MFRLLPLLIIYYKFNSQKEKSILLLDVAHDAVSGLGDEVENVLDFLTHGNLLRNLDDCILKAEVASIDDAVGIGNVTQDAIAGLDMLQHHGVDAMVGSGITPENDVGRYILLHTAATLDQRVAAHTHMLLHHHAIALNGTIMDFTLSGNAGTDTDDAMVEDMDIVADVHTVHDEVLVADKCGLVGISTSGYHHILADVVVIADDDLRGRTFHIVEILGCGTDDCILVNDITVSHRGAF